MFPKIPDFFSKYLQIPPFTFKKFWEPQQESPKLSMIETTWKKGICLLKNTLTAGVFYS